MKGFPEDEERRLVPRWRATSESVEQGELEPLAVQTAAGAVSDAELTYRSAEWREQPTIGRAGDLISAAVVARQPEAARLAAIQLLREDNVPSPLRRLAKQILGDEQPVQIDDDQSSVVKHLVASSSRRIGELRRLLRLTPVNPAAWVDLALHHSILGAAGKAEQAMSAALTLAPNHRMTLRAASRLFVHIHQPDIAVRFLRRAEVTRHDPWLLAAEIAISMVADRTPRFVKTARATASDERFSAFDRSELAAALASLELGAGKERVARKLFSQSLTEPTENVVAQAEWASRRLKLPELHERQAELPHSYEAESWSSFSAKNWSRALTEAWGWHSLEPFSSRPAVFGSFVASVITEDLEVAQDFALVGLESNPTDATLLNNLAFTLASADKVSSAMKIYQRIRASELEQDARIAWLATGGLIQYRLGNYREGLRAYETAIELARALGNVSHEIRATLFLIREEINRGNWEGGALLFAAAEQHAAGETEHGTPVIVDRIRRRLIEHGQK